MGLLEKKRTSLIILHLTDMLTEETFMVTEGILIRISIHIITESIFRLSQGIL